MSRGLRALIDVALLCRAYDLPQPQREFRFHRTRRWRFDFCWPDRMIAVEQEGGSWTRGRHTRGKGFEADCEKYNEANLAGWTVLRFTPAMIQSGAAAEVLRRALT